MYRLRTHVAVIIHACTVNLGSSLMLSLFNYKGLLIWEGLGDSESLGDIALGRSESVVGSDWRLTWLLTHH